jgi:hypothetical protein
MAASGPALLGPTAVVIARHCRASTAHGGGSRAASVPAGRRDGSGCLLRRWTGARARGRLAGVRDHRGSAQAGAGDVGTASALREAQAPPAMPPGGSATGTSALLGPVSSRLRFPYASQSVI